CVIVWINKILAGVIRRIDVDQLDAPKIWLEEQFENFEIVPLNEHVASGLKIDGLFRAGNQCSSARCLQQANGIVFSRPTEVKTPWARFASSPEGDPKLVEIDLALNECLRKNGT